MGVVPVDDGPALADGVQLMGHKGLAAEARFHRHHQHHVQLLHIGKDSLGAGDGPQCHCLFDAAAVHLRQGVSNAPGTVGLQVDADQICAGPDKVLNVAHRLFNHQVGVQEHVCVLVHRLADGHAVGDIGDEGAVHHVKVDHIGAFNGVQLLAQVGEVGGKDRGSDFNHNREPLSSYFQNSFKDWKS